MGSGGWCWLGALVGMSRGVRWLMPWERAGRDPYQGQQLAGWPIGLGLIRLDQESSWAQSTCAITVCPGPEVEVFRPGPCGPPGGGGGH